jgi:hypothetical protein
MRRVHRMEQLWIVRSMWPFSKRISSSNKCHHSVQDDTWVMSSGNNGNLYWRPSLLESLGNSCSQTPRQLQLHPDLAPAPPRSLEWSICHGWGREFPPWHVVWCGWRATRWRHFNGPTTARRHTWSDAPYFEAEMRWRTVFLTHWSLGTLCLYIYHHAYVHILIYYF